jgi:hypothetical protein
MKENKDKLKKMKEEYKQKVQAENETLELRISLLTRQIQEIPALQNEAKGIKTELEARRTEISVHDNKRYLIPHSTNRLSTKRSQC